MRSEVFVSRTELQAVLRDVFVLSQAYRPHGPPRRHRTVTCLARPRPLGPGARLDASIEQSGTYEDLARSLVTPPPAADEHSSCRLAIKAAMALVCRAAEAGVLHADTDAADVQALAAAIAWADGLSPPDPDRRTRLLRMMIDGMRPR
ncbi:MULTISPECIES: hypothetical protein [unclassified Streptomyces]|uniref:SbtR family transcriptional regulator n=1 Tax=unclassified Streptomyces TaxID=2593676 RepID=UPI0036E52337